MHPYMIDRMVQERQEELLRLAHADRRNRAASGSWLGRRRRKGHRARPAAAQPDITPACCPT